MCYLTQDYGVTDAEAQALRDAAKVTRAPSVDLVPLAWDLVRWSKPVTCSAIVAAWETVTTYLPETRV